VALILPKSVRAVLSKKHPTILANLNATALCSALGTTSDSNNSVSEQERPFQYVFDYLNSLKIPGEKAMEYEIAQHQAHLVDISITRRDHENSDKLVTAPLFVTSPIVEGMPSRHGMISQLYVGFAGSGSPVHYHWDAFNILLHGDKVW
jgi:hypothetical protein